MSHEIHRSPTRLNRPASLDLFFDSFLEHLIDNPFQFRLRRVLGSNHPFVVQKVNGRPPAHVPLPGDWASGPAPVPPGSPGDMLLLHRSAQTLLRVAIDAEQNKRLSFHSFHERPLVWVHGPAGASPIAPKINHHHLASVIEIGRAYV